MAVGTGVDASMAVYASTMNAIVQKYIEPTVFDQVLKATPVLYRFWRKGPQIDGGPALVWPVVTKMKQYGGWYSGAQNLSRGPEDVIQPAEVQWKHIYEDVTIPVTDLLKATTPHAKVDFVKTIFDTAILNLRQRISRALFGIILTSENPAQAIDHFFKAIDAGGTAVNQTVTLPDGTQVTVQIAGYSDYAGISHSNSYWQGIVKDANSTAVTLADIQTTYGQCSDGMEMPTLMVFTQAGFNYLWTQLQAQQRWMSDDEMARVGFTALKFNNATVVVDNNLPSGTALLINENWVDLVSHKDENFTIDPIIAGTPTERTLNTKICWTGNLRCKILRYQGKIIRATNL